MKSLCRWTNACWLPPVSTQVRHLPTLTTMRCTLPCCTRHPTPQLNLHQPATLPHLLTQGAPASEPRIIHWKRFQTRTWEGDAHLDKCRDPHTSTFNQKRWRSAIVLSRRPDQSTEKRVAAGSEARRTNSKHSPACGSGFFPHLC